MLDKKEYAERLLQREKEIKKEMIDFANALEITNSKSDYNRGYSDCRKEYEEKLRWIPIEEKLPEIGERVLLKNEFYEYVGFLSKNKKDFRALTVEISYSNEKINGVTHWRFL